MAALDPPAFNFQAKIEATSISFISPMHMICFCRLVDLCIDFKRNKIAIISRSLPLSVAFQLLLFWTETTGFEPPSAQQQGSRKLIC